MARHTFPKGHNLSGSRKGKPNVATKDIKLAFKELVEGNLENITKWMERVAKDDPKAALEFMYKFAQFNVPTLARTTTDITSGNKPLRNWQITTPIEDAQIIE